MLLHCCKLALYPLLQLPRRSAAICAAATFWQQRARQQERLDAPPQRRRHPQHVTASSQARVAAELLCQLRAQAQRLLAALLRDGGVEDLGVGPTGRSPRRRIEL